MTYHILVDVYACSAQKRASKLLLYYEVLLSRTSRLLVDLASDALLHQQRYSLTCCRMFVEPVKLFRGKI